MHSAVFRSSAYWHDVALAAVVIILGALCVLAIRVANRQDRRREYDARALVDALGGGDDE